MAKKHSNRFIFKNKEKCVKIIDELKEKKNTNEQEEFASNNDF